MVSHHIETRVAAPPATTLFAAASMIQNAIAAANNPKENLAGLDGLRLRLPMASQSMPNTGARTMTKTEFAAWSQVVGASQPKMWRSVKSRAKRLSEVGACSNALQKIVAKMKRTMMTTTRFFSLPVRPAKKNRYAK